MGLTKREQKRSGYQTQRIQQEPVTKINKDSQQLQGISQEPMMGVGMQPWTAWISQIRLNEQEVPEFFRASDATKQTVEIVEDEGSTPNYHLYTQGH